VPLLGLEVGEIEGWMREGGVREVRVFGGYNEDTYVKENSVDIVVVGEK
jgi:hypothetical protein